MVYSNKFVMSIIVDGQVLKEFGNGEAHIGFGKEYAIRLRNKHTDRYAVVKLFIDGEEQSKGGFIIPPSQHRDIERSSHSPRKFKFVALDSTEAQDHGKDQENVEKKMGVIEARFYLQKKKPEVKEVHHHHHHNNPVPVPYPVYPLPYPRRRPWFDDTPYYGVMGAGGQHTNCTRGGTKTCSTAGLESMGGAPESMGGAPEAMGAVMSADCGGAGVDDCEVTTDFCPEPTKGYTEISSQPGQRTKSRSLKKVVRDGATVEGAYSSQQFGEQWVDIEDDFTVLKVTLKGFDGEAPAERVAEAAVMPKPDLHADPVEGNKFCDQCGAKAPRAASKFCHACGCPLA